MITGYNTDVRHRDVVFHVQTEDKGTQNPCVESLVYVGGQILARKRAGYRSLLDQAEPEAAITELMERQHKTMIREIKSGELDEQVAAIQARKPKLEKAPPLGESRVEPPVDPAGRAGGSGGAAAGSRGGVEPPVDSPAGPPVRSSGDSADDLFDSSADSQSGPSSDSAAVRPSAGAPASPPARAPTKSPPGAADPAPDDARTSPGVSLPTPPTSPQPPTWVPPSQRGTPKPAPAARQAESGDEPDDRSLDQVILDYLEMESDQERLVLTMDPTEGDLTAGSDLSVKFTTRSSVDGDPIGETLITVRLICTIEEPQTLATGRTDDAGELELTLSIPELPAGSGAVIVSAESSIGKAEMRHLI